MSHRARATSGRVRLAALAALVLLATLVRGAPAAADAAAQARFFDESARRAFERGRYPEALELFLLAHEAGPSPRLLYNIAVCADLADQDAEAFVFFSEYLRAAEDDDPTRREDAERRMATMRERLALVEVVSDPPGATIFVDREELGAHGVTPRTIVVAPGEHRLLLSREDHAPSDSSVVAVSGQTVTAQASLARYRGTLVVDAVPAGATVVVLSGDDEVARGTAGEEMEVPVGRHVVRVEAEGHTADSAEAVVRRDARTRVRLRAEPIQEPVGRLLVATGNVTAEVSVDGRRAAETPTALDQLPVGDHQVELHAPGYERWRGTVTIREGRASHLNVTLLPRER